MSFGDRCMGCDSILEYNHTDIQILAERCIPCLYEAIAAQLGRDLAAVQHLMYQNRRNQNPLAVLRVQWAATVLGAEVKLAQRITPKAEPSSTPSNKSSPTPATPSPEQPDPTGTTT